MAPRKEEQNHERLQRFMDSSFACARPRRCKRGKRRALCRRQGWQSRRYIEYHRPGGRVLRKSPGSQIGSPSRHNPPHLQGSLLGESFLPSNLTSQQCEQRTVSMERSRKGASLPSICQPHGFKSAASLSAFLNGCGSALSRRLVLYHYLL